MKHLLLATVMATCGAIALAGTAAAQDVNQTQALTKLQDMHATGASQAAFTFIPQTGAKADQLRANLKAVHMPDGFKIDLYAIVPDARHMAVGNNTSTVFVGTRKDKVWVVSDRSHARVADEVKTFAPTIKFSNPNGVCISPDGVLYIAEHNRVLSFPAAEFFYESPDTALGIVAETIIPKNEESYNHGARTCRIGPDNKIYITVGQPYNVPPASKFEMYRKIGIGAMIRMDRDGGNREVFAYGMRNSVGQDFNPKNGDLWWTDNQVDGMGDDQPPGELNRSTKAGQDFGFPFFGGGHVRTVDYKDKTPGPDIVFPEIETAPHAADLGMTFYRGKQFPEKYRGAIFSVQHGSWNRTTPVGARIMITYLKPDGSADRMEPFAEGWLNDETGEYSGRPVDVAELKDGSLLVSDDYAGAIYRISYGK